MGAVYVLLSRGIESDPAVPQAELIARPVLCGKRRVLIVRNFLAVAVGANYGKVVEGFRCGASVDDQLDRKSVV